MGLIVRLFLAFIITFDCYAQVNRVVLLLSLNKDKNRPKLASKKYDINKKLASIFKKKLTKHDYELVIIKNARQSQIHQELISPKNKAVFFVGHANSRQAGGISTSAIMDDTGRDLKDIFKHINPNQQYVAMVGCQTEGLLNKWKNKGYYNSNKNLKFYTSKNKVNAKTGLRRSIRAFLKHEKKNELKSNPACMKESGIKVKITRLIPATTSPSYVESVRVLNNGKVLAVFGIGRPGEVQQIDTFLPLDSSYTKRQLKLTMQSGAKGTTPKDKISLGKFEIESNQNIDWSRFENRKGIPFGVGSNIYRVKNNINNKIEFTKGKQIHCKGEF